MRRSKRSWLSFVLIIGMLFTTGSFPEYTSAAGVDKTEAVKDTLSVTLKQGYTTISDENTDKIDMSRNISVDISFTPVFNTAVEADKRIEKGDYVEFDLGEKLKFTDEHESQTEWTSPIKDAGTQLKICDAIFTKNPTTGNIKVKFDFSNADDAVFTREDANVGASLKIKADSNYFDWTSTTEKIIRLFGKEYKIGRIDDICAITKTGVVDAKNHKIDWTIKIERYIKGVSPKEYLSLAGARILDKPHILSDSSGDYVDGTFKINGTLIDDTSPDFKRGMDPYNSNIKLYEYTIKNSDLDPANKGTAVVNLSTQIKFNGDFDSDYSTKVYTNDAEVVINNIGYKTAGWFTIHRFGSKSGRFESDDKKIIWTIYLNNENFDLGDVTVSDDLTKDAMDRVPQEFKNAYFQRFDKVTNTWKEEKTPVTPVASGINHKFNIPEVKEKIKLVIETEVDSDNYGLDFDNYAYAWWNGNDAEKIKIYGHASNRRDSSIFQGRIEKIAKSHRQGWNGLGGAEGYYVGPEPEWTVSANQNAVPEPGEYYMYDTFIFDKNIKVDADTVNAAKGFSIRKLGNNSVTALASGVAFDKLLPKEAGKHQRLLNLDNPIISSTDGITNAVYEIVKDGKVVGHILELKLVSGTDNFAKFKSKITEQRTLMSGWYGTDKKAQNYIVFTKGSQPVLNKTAAYKYLAKMLAKTTLSADAARKFLSDYNAEAVNDDVFNEDTKKAVSDEVKQKISYDRKSKSIIYRLSVNASGIKDLEGDIGKFIVKDQLGEYFKFAPIIEDAANPANNKYSLIYEGTAAHRYEGTDDVNVSDVYEQTVKAEGHYLSDSELAAKGITSEFGVGYYKGYANFKFDKLDGPYVIFLKAKLNENYAQPGDYNGKGKVRNIATIGIEGLDGTNTDDIDTEFDERFIWKDFDGNKIDIDEKGFIKWNLFYRPYKTYNDNNATKLRVEDEVSSNILLRKEKGTNKLIFDADNYQIWKGEFDQKGDFIHPVEITENLDKIFTYDTATRKLSIHIPDNDSSYKISYITDFADRVKRGDALYNSAALIESTTQKGRTLSAFHNVEADTFGRLRDKVYHRLEILKQNAVGDNLEAAEFNLKRLASGGMVAEDFGTRKTGLDGKIKFTNLTRGEYELTEVTAPEGYKKSEAPYRLKVMELEDGFKVELIGDYANKAMIDKNNLTLINDTKENSPNNPPNNPPSKPGNPSNPNPNPNPHTNPLNPPSPPTPPIPSKSTNPMTPPNDNPSRPGTPTYPRGNTPDPNDPRSPNRITIIDENGTPLGNFVKKSKPDGSVEYVPDEEVPFVNAKMEYKPVLPQTGAGNNGWFYMGCAGLMLIFAGLTLTMRKEEEN